MSKKYDNSNRIALWENDDKQTERHPDIKGSGEVVCEHCKKSTEFWAAGWYKGPDASDRAPVISVSLQSKIEAEEKRPTNTRPKKGAKKKIESPADVEDFDEDVPF